MAKCKLLFTVQLIFVIFISLSLVASADTGPKPTVSISFEGEAPSADMYFAFLSSSSVSPPTVGDLVADETRNDEIDLYFLALADTLGLYYHTKYTSVKGVDGFILNYPPSHFVIALYHPSTGTLFLTEPTERYAHDSYYTLELSNLFTDGERHALLLQQTYQGKTEAIKLVMRIAITLAVELSVAYLLFRVRRVPSLIIIAVLNIITQLYLNLSLNRALLSSPISAYFAFFIFLEVTLTVIEAIMLSAFLPFFEDPTKKRSRYLCLALVQNLSSVLLGFLLSLALPSIF